MRSEFRGRAQTATQMNIQTQGNAIKWPYFAMTTVAKILFVKKECGKAATLLGVIVPDKGLKYAFSNSTAKHFLFLAIKLTREISFSCRPDCQAHWLFIMIRK